MGRLGSDAPAYTDNRKTERRRREQERNAKQRQSCRTHLERHIVWRQKLRAVLVVVGFFSQPYKCSERILGRKRMARPSQTTHTHTHANRQQHAQLTTAYKTGTHAQLYVHTYDIHMHWPYIRRTAQRLLSGLQYCASEKRRVRMMCRETRTTLQLLVAVCARALMRVCVLQRKNSKSTVSCWFVFACITFLLCLLEPAFALRM